MHVHMVWERAWVHVSTSGGFGAARRRVRVEGYELHRLRSHVSE